MSEDLDGEKFLAACSVAPEIFALRPDYRVLLMIVDWPSPLIASADRLVAEAEARARALLAESPVDRLPHIAAWREAYRAFGAKPQRTRNSVEALTRRAEQGLPRVNALTDIYNAVSVLHQVPIGGEDLLAYQGSARLTRARGDEAFDTVSDGATTIEHPQPGEVIWRDDDGVTCRRWNWRQGRRTALTDATTAAVFIFDALAPLADTELSAAADDLAAALGGATTARRVIGARS